MAYTHERNYGCRVSADYTYRGLRTVVLENRMLRISVLADKGTDIIEFLYKPKDVDFLWRSPLGVRNPSLAVETKAAAIGSFLDYFEGGWQLCFPNGGWATNYKNAELGLHGELCNVPWSVAILRDEPEEIAVKFSARTYRTPFYMERTFSLSGERPVLTLREKVVNEGEEEMDLMWGQHPSLGPPFLSEHCRIDAPARKVEICTQAAPNTRLKPGETFPWPIVEGRDGKPLDLSRIAPPNARVADQAYLLEFEDGWFAVTNEEQRVGFGLRFQKDVFPYVWYWMDYHGEMGYPLYGRTYVIALEPFTSYPRFGLAEAVKRGRQMTLAAAETVEVEFQAVAFEGAETVSRITENGDVLREHASA